MDTLSELENNEDEEYALGWGADDDFLGNNGGFVDEEEGKGEEDENWDYYGLPLPD